MNTNIEQPDPKKHSGMVTVAYILLALGYFTVLTTSLFGLILAYLKRSDVRSTYLESHCDLLIGVFWWSTFWYLLGGILFITLIGIPLAWIIWAVSYVWTAYKLLKGFLKIHAELPV